MTPEPRDPRCSSLDDAVDELVWWLGFDLACCCVGKNEHDRDKLLALADAVREFRAEPDTRERGDKC